MPKKSLMRQGLLTAAILAGIAVVVSTRYSTASRLSAPASTPDLWRSDPRRIGPAKPDEQFLIEQAHEKIQAKAQDVAIGYWVGAFGKNKINIALAEVLEETASGHSVCAGNYRPIAGSVTKRGSSREFVLREPGDDPHDGVFRFTVDAEKETLHGTWTPYVAKGNSPKVYALKKREYLYAPDVGDHPEASLRLLTDEELANMLPETLELMRNEIYARHGYCFKNKTHRYHFEAKDWYIPLSVDVRGDLTDVEAANITSIYRYEEYYKEKYDDYGR